MPATYCRHGVVAGLVLAAGLGAGAVRPSPPGPAVFPSGSRLVAGAGWRVVDRGWSGPQYTQWTLRDRRGTAALLYVEAASKAQRALSWSGDLGFEGAGYVVVWRQAQGVALGHGDEARVTAAVVQRAGDRRSVVYAVVSPAGIAADGWADVIRVAWNALRGEAGPYYLVRTSVRVQPILAGDAIARTTALQLLAAVLPRLHNLALRAGG